MPEDDVLRPPETVPGLLARRIEDDADVDAIVTWDERVTFGGLDDASTVLAGRLVAAGVGPGDRVGLLAANGIDWVVHALAVTRIGAVLVPFSTLLRPPELVAQLHTAGATHLVTAAEFRNRRYLDELDDAIPGVLAVDDAHRRPELPALRAVWMLGHVPCEPVDPGVVRALGDDVTPADDLVVLFTSGSRGAPKGVIHTHGGALRAAAAGLGVRCIGPGDVLYVPMPFFWTGGFSTGLVSALVAGATLLVEDQPEPARTLAFLERERATVFRGWPDQAAQLAAHPDFATTDLTSLGDGSLTAVLPAERRPRPGARPNIFGMTETFGPYCADRLDVDMPEREHGSCGRPLAGVEVSVHDPETGVVRTSGEDGEIWVRGPNVLRGICGRERAEVFTADGWYRTGDLGRIDAAGYLWYAGRLDDMVKVRGATVYPSEVEAALRAVDGVREAYVTDVAAGDSAHESRRQIAALLVTTEPLDTVVAGVRERLSSFKLPTRWLVVDDGEAVPRLASAKVDKPALQRLLTDHAGIQRSV